MTTDEIYKDAVAVEEGFEKWWPLALALEEFLLDKFSMEGRMLAKAAYRAGWEAGHEHARNLHEDPNVAKQHDWHNLAAVVRETTDLAQRHNLVIGSFQNKPASPRVIRAERSGFCVEAPNWSALLALLKGMEKQGDL